MTRNPSAGEKSDSSCLPVQGVGDSIKGDCVEGDSAQPRSSKTICIPRKPESYAKLVKDPTCFRHYVEGVYGQHPELFPAAMGEGYKCHDVLPASVKLGLRLRRIKLVATGDVYNVCPSFVLPYMIGFTADVAHALFLQGIDVLYWALTHVFGRIDMYWYRLAAAFGRDRNSRNHGEEPGELAERPVGRREAFHARW